MTIKIDQDIVAYRVGKSTQQSPPREFRELGEVVQMNESLERPDALRGMTYKIKTPASEHALYITINDIVLNEGTAHELRRPFEIFINSKNLDHFQWIVALTRIMSAVFRKGGDVTFLVEELHSVFDPRGGYFKGGRFVPSLIAEIGDVIERHLREIGLLHEEGLDEHQQRHVQAAREKYEAARPADDGKGNDGFPAGAALCSRCLNSAVVRLDNCTTCLNCGDSRCS